MNASVRIFPDNQGHTEINLSIPSNKADVILDALRGMLPLAGLKLRQVNEDGEEVFGAAEVFPSASPAMALRGFRGKMEWTQQELAERLGTTQNCVSDMKVVSVPFQKQWLFVWVRSLTFHTKPFCRNAHQTA